VNLRKDHYHTKIQDLFLSIVNVCLCWTCLDDCFWSMSLSVLSAAACLWLESTRVYTFGCAWTVDPDNLFLSLCCGSACPLLLASGIHVTVIQ
jgi:hypothetical protein